MIHFTPTRHHDVWLYVCYCTKMPGPFLVLRKQTTKQTVTLQRGLHLSRTSEEVGTSLGESDATDYRKQDALAVARTEFITHGHA